MLFNKVHAFFNPEQFQGWGKTKNYFEGWYFKVVNADATKAFAFIPGIAMDAAGNKHSFIQLPAITGLLRMIFTPSLKTLG